MSHWIQEAVFYHIYPLGFCGAPRFAKEEETTVPRIRKLMDWIEHFQEMNVNALYLGPVNASYEHGYDTSDYRMIDHRLGTKEDFKEVCDALHNAGIRIVLDGVFNHVGREFWAFQDVLSHGSSSPYKDWFYQISFDQTSPYGDPFSYEAWGGHYNLVKLNLQNNEVVEYLLESVGEWMREYHIDGLRLDAADCIDHDFFRRLKAYTKERDPEFWLMGEIIHGNYCVWANPELLDSVTNYECYKGLYSSHNTNNYFEIAYSLNRQFGNGGIYHDLTLYNFVDNHDVNRLASTITDEHDLFNVYTLLYTMPGIPSIYYGSEFAITGTKHDGSDADLRPAIDLSEMDQTHPLYQHICKLGKLRATSAPLQHGTYEQVLIRNEQYVFKRTAKQESIYVAFNLSDEPYELQLPIKEGMLDSCHDQEYPSDGAVTTVMLQPHDSAVLTIQKEEQGTPKQPSMLESPIEMREDEAALRLKNQADMELNNQQPIHEVKVQQPEAIMSARKHIERDGACEEKEIEAVEKEHETKRYGEAEPSRHIPPQETTMTQVAAVPTIKLGKYRHYKGLDYVVLYVATHSETLEPYVVYRQLYGTCAVWIRPLSMFTEIVTVDGTSVPRFAYIGK